MSLKFSFFVLFLTVCAIHLCECDYPEYDDVDDDYSSLLSKDKNNENEKAEKEKKPPKEFYVPSVSFVPYSQMKTQIKINAPNPGPAPKTTQTKTTKKKKKKPCKHSSHGRDNRGEGDGDAGEGDDFNDGHDDQGSHTFYGGRSRRSHGEPTVRAHHSQQVRNSNLPRVREIIKKYTIDLMENNDSF